jgi:geranylgeranyl pyrophosphate synthase
MPKTTRLERLASQVDRALARLLPAATRSPSVVHEAMRYCVFSGGKRFRPLLCLGGCEAAGGAAGQALSAACAIELLHTYSLVHDDLPAMDNADERRGKPSCHRRFGEGTAILVGDALLTLAFETLSRDGMPNAMAVIRLLGRACGTGGLIGGQALDLQAVSQPGGPTERALTEIARRKTAALITASVIAGALAGGGGPSSVKRLARYGQGIGLAFQLLDDVHDREGLAQAMGDEAARAQSQRLIARAVAHLEPFGTRADTLRQLAAWLAST